MNSPTSPLRAFLPVGATPEHHVELEKEIREPVSSPFGRQIGDEAKMPHLSDEIVETAGGWF
jgi:hypothetical protein